MDSYIVDKSNDRDKNFHADNDPESPEEIFALMKLDFIKYVFEMLGVDRALCNDQDGEEEENNDELDGAEGEPKGLSVF